ncbi:MAG: hypothetical protein PF508_17055 [Spirochaeta sp.]|jgi:hypothetical protein|nr:hypothetical protein [Spirochaeta sp.]
MSRKTVAGYRGIVHPRAPGFTHLVLLALISGLALLSGGEVVAQPIDPTPIPVYVDTFRNMSENPGLDSLGSIITRDLRLTIVLLDGFRVAERSESAEVEIVGVVSQDEVGNYTTSVSVRNRGSGEIVTEETETFSSVFDVFDTGAEVGRRLMSTYTNRALTYGSLAVSLSSPAPAVGIFLAGESLDANALNLDRVLAGSYPFEVGFDGYEPFYSREVVIAEGERTVVNVAVPRLSPDEYQDRMAQRVSALLEQGQAARRPEVPDRGAAGDGAPFDRYLAAADRFVEVATGRRVLRFHQTPIVVDGDATDWESIPILSFDRGTDERADLRTVQLAADDDTLYGFVRVGTFNDGDGFELSIYPHRDTGVRNGTIANVTAGVRSGQTVYLAVFKNPNPDGGGEWTTGYRTTRNAIRGAEGIEFSIPISSFQFRGAEGTLNGVPRQIYIDVEGVTLEPSGEDFDHGGGDTIPGVLVQFL